MEWLVDDTPTKPHSQNTPAPEKIVTWRGHSELGGLEEIYMGRKKEEGRRKEEGEREKLID